MDDKSLQIESLSSIEELGNIVRVVSSKSNIEVINYHPPFLEGTVEVPSIGTQSILYYLTTDYLGRNYERYETLKSQVEKKLKIGQFSSVVVVSNKNITEGFKEKIKKELLGYRIIFWNRDDLVGKIDESYEEFWRHTDHELLAFEKAFESEINEDWAIKKIKQFKTAHSKLLNIFIEPRLLHKVNSVESPQKAFVKIPIAKLHTFQVPTILEGEPGIGKTRLLKQIGLEFIKDNTKQSKFYYVPVFLNNINLIETRDGTNDKVSIIKAIEKKLSTYFSDSQLDSVIKKYKIVLLIDSIDEFDKENQSQITSDLKKYYDEGHINIFLGTRYQDYSLINGINEIGKIEEVYIEKFNDTQIKHFISLYFKHNTVLAENLIESLKENGIIQRLPITPLNLSLITILYEENNFEIPATITDIYDNFSNLLLGRSLADSRFDFFDITIRERILSAYALELLQRGERNYMTIDEFISYFESFFKPVEGTINLTLLPEALKFIINNTGILILQDGKYVKFMHESYLEYYASREIFYYKRDEVESALIENFLDITWQYTAIFYAGRTKQMNNFLQKVIERTQKSGKVIEFYKSVSGLGYLNQALYMTDDNLRKEAIKSSLEYTVELYEWMKKLSADDVFLFKNLSLPLTAIINTMLFFEYNNSISVKRPLELAFDELLDKLEVTGEKGQTTIDSAIAYKLFSIALTLASPRLNNLDKIKHLIYETAVLNDPIFERLLDFGVSIAGSKSLYQLKDDFKRPNKIRSNFPKDMVRYNKDVHDLYLTAPAGRFRFSAYDKISPNRKVSILTEGKTDAQIIEHAYNILTGLVPYWEILPVHESSGGATELGKCIGNFNPQLVPEKVVIGLFDNDEKGISEFNGALKESRFSNYNEYKRIKKCIDGNLYGLKLPIPPSRQNYYQQDQKFNYFAIEHYFSDELLNKYKMLEETPIPGIYRITDKASKKTEFSKMIRQISNPVEFKDFYFLFKDIDMISGVDYIEYDI